MGKLAFGWDETISCITPVPLKGASDEALCVAHKTSTLFVAGGVYVRDDGYVLGVEGEAGGYYPWPEPGELARYQSTGMLPQPLPPYSIDAFQYLIGYSLWLGILVAVAISMFKRWSTKRRQADDAMTPVSYGPPTLRTDADRFLAGEVAKLLEPGERTLHQALAHAVPDAASRVHYLALTDRRLLLFTGKRGAFKPLLEMTGVEVFPRADLLGVKEVAYELTFSLGGDRTLELAIPSSEKHFSNQRVFVRDVPRLLAMGGVAAAAGVVPA